MAHLLTTTTHQQLIRQCDRWLNQAGAGQLGKTYPLDAELALCLLLRRLVEDGQRGAIKAALELCYRRVGYQPRLQEGVREQLARWGLGLSYAVLADLSLHNLQLWAIHGHYRRHSAKPAPFGWLLASQARPQPTPPKAARAMPKAVRSEPLPLTQLQRAWQRAQGEQP